MGTPGIHVANYLTRCNSVAARNIINNIPYALVTVKEVLDDSLEDVREVSTFEG